MSRLIMILMLPICVAGCVSFSSSDPSPPQKTTVVTPAPGTTTTICSPAPC